MALPLRHVCRLVCCLAVLITGCGRIEPPEESGELVVAILSDPVFYQPALPEAEASGFEFDLLSAFADQLKLKLRLVPATTPAELRSLLADGRVHFAAAMPVQEATMPAFSYSSPLRKTRQLLVQHADSVPLDDPGALAGHTVETLAGSPQVRTLRGLADAATISLVEVSDSDELGLLEDVAERRSELAATDSIHLDLAVNFHPDLVVAQELPGETTYAWAFAVDDEGLRRRAEAFIAAFRADGRLARLTDRYFGHMKRINPIGAAKFIDDLQTRLPHYRQDFQHAQAISGIDWRLLAALAYQESKWDPLATSPTGVRGIMMLTEDTADRLGVKNRLDAKESIRAGSEYLADLMEELPDEVEDPDRLWLALAAYNLGLGHLNGARQFALALKRDPDSWFDMKKVLPLLAKPEYYLRLKSGRARGGEAVILVENIRTYYDILARFEPPYSPGFMRR